MRGLSSDARSFKLGDELSQCTNLTAWQLGLYRQILAFRFDEKLGDTIFVQQLVKENGWAVEYANRVVLEYKRFMFLAAVAGHPVSPSEPVDKVWHLHVTDTKSYWMRLCADVIGKPVHRRASATTQSEMYNFLVIYVESIVW